MSDDDLFHTFFRAGSPCILFYDSRMDCWLGFIGLNNKHYLYGAYCRNINNIRLYKFSVNENILSNYAHEESVLKQLWWMGFDSNPYSKEKTLDKLKALADYLAVDKLVTADYIY
jgi:hypothetical protein